jgi:ribonuclease P protein component
VPKVCPCLKPIRNKVDYEIGPKHPMERLKRRTDFRAAAAGARAPGKAFVLQARKRDQAGGDRDAVRVGFTVSKQVGNAVVRNRVRRRLREAVRLVADAPLCAGHDYVLIGRRAALALPFGDLVRDFATALRRVHLPELASQLTGGDGTGAANQRPPHNAGSSHRPLRRQIAAKRPTKSSAKRPAKSPE